MRFVFLLATIGMAGSLAAQSITDRFQQTVDSVFRQHPEMLGVLVHVESPDKKISWTYAAGNDGMESDKKVSATQPLLIASNTKTYLAATILRLVEMKKLAIDQPVKDLVSEQSRKVLLAAGYQLDSITIRQLLSHTSGIRDYVDEGYFTFISQHKTHRWSREEQIARAASLGGPLGKPGSVFKYGDVNYVLISEVVEHATGEPFYTAARKLLNYKKHGLKHTAFIRLEKEMPDRVNQHWGRFSWEIKELDPSWDLYGGGGIASTVYEMARFYQLLFDGKIIRDKQVLNLMSTDVLPGPEVNYCLGIRKINIGSVSGYNHGGGLGTDVTFFPELRATISIASVEADKRPVALQIRDLLLNLLKSI